MKTTYKLSSCILTFSLASFFSPNLWADTNLPDSLNDSSEVYSWATSKPMEGSGVTSTPPSVEIAGVNYYLDTNDILRQTSFSVNPSSSDSSINLTLSDSGGTLSLSDDVGNIYTGIKDETTGAIIYTIEVNGESFQVTVGETIAGVDGAADTYTYLSYTLSGVKTTVNANSTATKYYYWGETTGDRATGSMGLVEVTDTGSLSSSDYDFSASSISNYVGKTSTASGGVISAGAARTLVGDFIGNCVNFANASNVAYGGAVHLSGGTSTITGNFIANYVYNGKFGGAYGGAVSTTSAANISAIKGNFIGNYAYSLNSSAVGGALRNAGVMGGTVSAGAIGGVVGDFIGNYACGATFAQGGAIWSNKAIYDIEGDFISNYVYSATSAKGGAVYNSAIISFKASDDDGAGSHYYYTGNYASSSSASTPSATDDENGGFLYMAGGTASFNVDTNSSITIGYADGDTVADGYDYAGYDSIAGVESAIITKDGKGTLTVNSSMQYYYGVLNIAEGTMYYNNEALLTKLSSLSISEGATFAIGLDTLIDSSFVTSGDDYNYANAGTISLTSGTLSSLSDLTSSYGTIQIDELGTVSAQASYIDIALVNNGTLNLTGSSEAEGTLSSAITGAGSIVIAENNNIYSDASNFGNAVSNAGTLNLTGGTLANSITNTGTISIAGTVTTDVALGGKISISVADSAKLIISSSVTSWSWSDIDLAITVDSSITDSAITVIAGVSSSFSDYSEMDVLVYDTDGEKLTYGDDYTLSLDAEGNLQITLKEDEVTPAPDPSEKAETYTIISEANGETQYALSDDIDNVTITGLTVSVAENAEVKGDVYLVYGEAIVEGDVELKLSQGIFYGDINVVGTEFDSVNGNKVGTVNGNVLITITGGTFYNDINAGADTAYNGSEYADGAVTGNITVNLSGNTATFVENAENGTPTINGGDKTSGVGDNVATLNISAYNTQNADLGNFVIENFDILKVSGASNVNASLEINRNLTMSISDKSNFEGAYLLQGNGSSLITVEEGSALSFGYIEMNKSASSLANSLEIKGALSLNYNGENSLVSLAGNSVFTAESISANVSGISFEASPIFVNIEAGSSFTADSFDLNLDNVTSSADLSVFNGASVNVGSINLNVYNTLAMQNGASLKIASNETLNVYGNISGNLSLGAGATLNVIIGADNIGTTEGVLGSITGEGSYNITISFDTDSLASVDLTDTSIYLDYSDTSADADGTLSFVFSGTELDDDGFDTITIGDTIYNVSIDANGLLSFEEVGESGGGDSGGDDNDGSNDSDLTYDKDDLIGKPDGDSEGGTTSLNDGDTTVTFAEDGSKVDSDVDTAFSVDKEAEKGTVTFEGKMVFEGTGDKTGVELNSDDTTIAGNLSATYEKTDDADEGDLSLVQTNTGTVTFEKDTSLSAIIIDTEGNESNGTAITNKHEESAEESNGLNLVLKGELNVIGNIVANSPFILTAESDKVTDGVLNLTGDITTNTGGEEYIEITDTTLNIEGDIIAGAGDITVTDGELNATNSTITTSGNITLAGSELSLTDSTLDGVSGIYMTTDAAGNMSSITVDNSDLDGAEVAIVGSASMLVGSVYEDIIDGVDDKDVESYHGEFGVENGTVKVESLSYFTDSASNANEASLGAALDALEVSDDDKINELLISSKLEVEAQGVDSFIMDNNSNISEINSILLNNLNLANVNRARDLLQKSKGSYILIDGFNPNEADYIKYSRDNELSYRSTVAQLQSINLLGSKDAQNGIAGYDYWSVGSTANIDQVLSENAIIGLSLGGVYSKTKGDAGDNASSTAFLANVYSVFKPTEKLEVLANLGYAHFWNKGSKGSASSEWESDAINALFGASYRIETTLEGLSLSPLAMINMVYLHNNAAEYSNNVEVDSNSYFSAKLMLGLELEYAMTKNFAMKLMAMYACELADDSFDNTYSITSSNGLTLSDISYAGSELSKGSGVLGLGFSYDFSDTCTGYFDYTAYIYETLITHSLNLSVALKF